jgi:hypothetical protein
MPLTRHKPDTYRFIKSRVGSIGRAEEEKWEP